MRIKILSWNIWYDYGRFDEISKFLLDSKADIIGLQEIIPDDQTHDAINFLKKSGYQSVFGPSFKTEDGRTVGNGIFSKHRILKSEVYDLSDQGNRSAVSADVSVNGKIVHVFVTHLSHGHLKPMPEHTAQAKKLIKFLPGSDTILMGDLNATPDQPGIQLLENMLTNADPAHSPTWSLYPEGCKVCKPQKLDVCFDYIFTTKDLKITNFKVESSKASDHLPVSAVVEIQA